MSNLPKNQPIVKVIIMAKKEKHLHFLKLQAYLKPNDVTKIVMAWI